MKRFLLSAVVVLFTIQPLLSQTKPKPKQKETAPTQKEMEEMMKEAQKAMDGLDPKAKRMMDSLGIKIPSFNNLPNVTDQQLADAAEEDERVIPSKKTELIAKLPKKTLTNAELASFVRTTNSSIAGLITPKSKALAEKAIVQFKNDPYYGAMIASTANGMWIMGLKQPAVYLMGKATEVLPNADNYNNYAAYLTMTGAGHMAIPVLEKLNRAHKNNSTVLNNLGQAWLQLGDADKANKYLDSAIRVYANHPQANYTKCLILESEGKTAEAVVALKRSLKHSVTKSKLEKLDKLEKNKSSRPAYYTPKTYFSTSFNLGVYTALIPSNYTNKPGMTIEQEWQFFRQQLSGEMQGLDAAIRMADQKSQQELQHMQTNMRKYNQAGFSPYYLRAISTLSSSNGYNEHSFEQQGREGTKYLMQWATNKKDFELEINTEKERFEREAPNEVLINGNCARELSIITKHLKFINDLNLSYRDAHVRQWATDAYNQYNYVTAIAPTSGVALKGALEIKRDFVRKLSELKHEFYNLTDCVPEQEEKKKSKKKLPDYDKINCKTSSSLYVPLTGQITIRCNEMITVFNPTYLPVKASWTEDFNADRITEASVGVTIKAVDITVSGKRDENGNFESGKISIGKEIKGIDVSVNGEFDANGFTKGSVELGVANSLSLLPKAITDAAPVDVSLKGELGVGLELGPEGISDFYVKDKASLDMSASIKSDFDTSGDETTGLINEIANGGNLQLEAPKVAAGASISADNRVGVNSGYSGKVSSEFSGLRVK